MRQNARGAPLRPSIHMSQKVLIASAEVAPLAKVGGLADVASSLPKQLRSQGHDVRIVMPAYAMALQNPDFEFHLRAEFKVEINSNRNVWAKLYETELDGVTVYLLDGEDWFCNASESALVYAAGMEAYLFFARATLEVCLQLDWKPNVIHANDWHTGFLPVYMRESGSEWSETGAVFTIHNLAYQGEFGIEALDLAGLPRSLFNYHQVEAYGAVNFLKAGCAYADQVNTVSPRYAEEIQTPEYGCRLDGLMRHLHEFGRLSGIVNGLDLGEWNPETDPHIATNFSLGQPAGKAACREALADELGLPKEGPLMGVVSRLSSQKGMDLMLEVAEGLMADGASLVVQGLGDPWLAEQFRAWQGRYPGRMRFVEKFDAALAQRIYAGSDMFLMPSAFEPCGLGQLIALRYGTIPVVRHTGGLANTVFEGENGFVFFEKNPAEFLGAVDRAKATFADKVAWSKLVQEALAGDYGWSKSGLAYEALYRQAMERRRQIERPVRA